MNFRASGRHGKLLRSAREAPLIWSTREALCSLQDAPWSTQEALQPGLHTNQSICCLMNFTVQWIPVPLVATGSSSDWHGRLLWFDRHGRLSVSYRMLLDWHRRPSNQTCIPINSLSRFTWIDSFFRRIDSIDWIPLHRDLIGDWVDPLS